MFKIDAILGSKKIPLKEISSFEKGSVINIGIPVGSKVKCFHNDNYLFDGDVIIFEQNLAIKLTDLQNNSDLFKDNESYDICFTSLSEKNKDFPDFSFLNNVTPKYFIDFIKKEHPQLIALVLIHCSEQFISDVFKLLPSDLRAEIFIRMSNISYVNPSIINLVSLSLQKTFKNSDSIGGTNFVQSIFNKLDKDIAEDIVNKVSQINLDIAERIQNELN